MLKEPKLSFISKVEQKNSYRNILNYSKKIVKLSEEELKNHGKFLKSELKKNYF